MPELDKSLICKGCWSQMHMPIPIRGPLSLPFKLVGIRISKMNPNICTICERAFARVKKAKQITVQTTILFADIRGYTRLSERVGAAEVASLLSVFHDECATAIWTQDGIVNKTMGDGLMAIFNFPIPVDDHPRQALVAALGLQERCTRNLGKLKDELELAGSEIGVGVGLHSGEVAMGEFGGVPIDFTAIGSVVNLAARLESSAAAGEILMTEEVYRHARDLCGAAERRLISVKGLADAVDVFALRK